MGDLVFTESVSMFTIAIGVANFYREVFGFFVAAKRRKKREKGYAAAPLTERS
jgi:hypothetical protein